MNFRILISSITISIYLTLTACGGGGDETAVDKTKSITLNSASEGGNANFSALLLQPIIGTVLSKTGIVLLHGRGGNPDSAVVRQLRKDLYDRGYTTLSIQEAVPGTFVEGDSVNKPPYSDYVDDVNDNANSVFLETYARVRTAINELEARAITKVVVIGFSLGSRMAAAYVARGQIGGVLSVAGLVGIGMYAGDLDPDPLKTTLTLAEVDIPVLDIYGSNDDPSVSTAAARKAAYDAGIGDVANYTQEALDCGGVSNPDCHKLVNLKGSSTSPLEMAVSNWIGNL